ncbi:MAG: hypothetical protein KBT36_04090 [Kurthia sp.]|nr:hypothetical protein [Candidatus Kurthia equi]
MTEKFKSSAVKLYFLAGYDGDKEMRKIKTYGNVSENSSMEDIEVFKNGIAGLSDLQLLETDVIITKTI